MSLRHLALVRLQDTEMALYVLKRSGDFLCLSSPLSLLPFFDDCQRAIQDSAVIGNGAFYWGYCPDTFELPIQTS